MPMIICPECAKRITNNVEKCPNCECTKDKFVTLMDRKEQDLIMLRLGKYQVRFNGKYWNYIQLRRVYELNARQLRRQLRSVYDRTTDFGSIINSFPHIVEIKMKQMLEWSMKLLYECKIPMTAGVFLDKYLEKNHYYVGNWRYYHLDYNEIINEIIEQYMGIADDNVAISELKNSVRVQQRLIDGAYHVILAIFYAVLNELLENEAIDTLDYKQERENEAIQRMIADINKEAEKFRISHNVNILKIVVDVMFYILNEMPLGELLKKRMPAQIFAREHFYHLLDELEAKQKKTMELVRQNGCEIDWIKCFYEMAYENKIFCRAPIDDMNKKESDGNRIYLDGDKMYVSEITLINGVKMYFSYSEEKMAEARKMTRKLINSLKSEKILLNDASGSNTKKKKGKRFYVVDRERLEMFCRCYTWE